MRQDVSGSLDGQPFDYHTYIEMSRLPGEVDFTRELGGSEEPASYFHAITDGEAVYRWTNASQNCQGEAGQLGVGETREPASLLYNLTGATKKGTELVNQIQTTHYQFDQDDLRIATPKPKATGELWIADQGGYVVKMTLTIAPPSSPTGKGMEVGQDWTYEVSQVNAVDSIELPQGCLPVPVEIPAMPDAQEITRGSGLLSFITTSPAAEVVNLYFQALPKLGWMTDQKKPAGELNLPMSFLFTKGEQKLALNIDNSFQTGVDVDLVISAVEAVLPAATATPGDALPPTPAPTVNPLDSGLPEDIPLYPGVTGMIKNGGVVMVYSSDPVSNLVEFYLAQMPGLGWNLTQNFQSDSNTLLLWQKQDRNISISIIPSDGVTLLVIDTQSQ